MGRPFEAITVVEFTGAVAGPLVGKLLADYGARVIVIESQSVLTKRGSSREPTGAKKQPSLNLGPLFNKCGANKLSVTLNLQRPEGVQLARKIIEKSDIVIDNFPPKTLEKWGFSYEAVASIKRDIIMLRFPTVSTEGRHKYQNSTSWNVLAMAGWNYMTGFDNSIPISASRYSVPDESSSPFHAAIALLAVLYQKAKTGKGEYIELSIYEGALALAGLGLLEYLANGDLPRRMGNRLEDAAPHGVYRCLGNDRWCAIAVFSEEGWTAFCRVVGAEQLLGDPRFADLAARKRNEDELDRIVERWTLSREARDVMMILQGIGIAAGVVEDASDLLNWDPQLLQRNFWTTMQHPEAGKLVGAGWGFRLAEVEPLRGRPPLLGEQNDYVLGEVLGLSEEEINEYIVDGVVY